MKHFQNFAHTRNCRKKRGLTGMELRDLIGENSKKFNRIVKSNKLSKCTGFTLVELIVVIGILLVLSVLSAIAYTNVTQMARVAADRADANTVARALNTYNELLNDDNAWICSEEDLQQTVIDNRFNLLLTLDNSIVDMDLSVSVDDFSSVDRIISMIDNIGNVAPDSPPFWVVRQ